MSQGRCWKSSPRWARVSLRTLWSSWRESLGYLRRKVHSAEALLPALPSCLWTLSVGCSPPGRLCSFCTGSRSAAAAAAAAEHAGKGRRKASTEAAQAEGRANREAVKAERAAADMSQLAAQKAKNSEEAVDQMLAELKARLQRDKGDGNGAEK